MASHLQISRDETAEVVSLHIGFALCCNFYERPNVWRMKMIIFIMFGCVLLKLPVPVKQTRTNIEKRVMK